MGLGLEGQARPLRRPEPPHAVRGRLAQAQARQAGGVRLVPHARSHRDGRRLQLGHRRARPARPRRPREPEDADADPRLAGRRGAPRRRGRGALARVHAHGRRHVRVGRRPLRPARRRRARPTSLAGADRRPRQEVDHAGRVRRQPLGRRHRVGHRVHVGQRRQLAAGQRHDRRAGHAVARAGPLVGGAHRRVGRLRRRRAVAAAHAGDDAPAARHRRRRGDGATRARRLVVARDARAAGRLRGRPQARGRAQLDRARRAAWALRGARQHREGRLGRHLDGDGDRDGGARDPAVARHAAAAGEGAEGERLGGDRGGAAPDRPAQDEARRRGAAQRGARGRLPPDGVQGEARARQPQDGARVARAVVRLPAHRASAFRRRRHQVHEGAVRADGLHPVRGAAVPLRDAAPRRRDRVGPARPDRRRPALRQPLQGARRVLRAVVAIARHLGGHVAHTHADGDARECEGDAPPQRGPGYARAIARHRPRPRPRTRPRTRALAHALTPAAPARRSTT